MNGWFGAALELNDRYETISRVSLHGRQQQLVSARCKKVNFRRPLTGVELTSSNGNRRRRPERR
jgi:hypothetical protein